MDPQAAKMIGAGIACIGMGGAGVGVGTIFGHYLAAALRNPSAAQGQFGNLIFGFAVTEALGIFSLLIALLLLFASDLGASRRGVIRRAGSEGHMAQKKRRGRTLEHVRRKQPAAFRRSKDIRLQLVWLVFVRGALSADVADALPASGDPRTRRQRRWRRRKPRASRPVGRASPSTALADARNRARLPMRRAKHAAGGPPARRSTRRSTPYRGRRTIGERRQQP